MNKREILQIRNNIKHFLNGQGFRITDEHLEPDETVVMTFTDGKTGVTIIDYDEDEP